MTPLFLISSIQCLSCGTWFFTLHRLTGTLNYHMDSEISTRGAIKTSPKSDVNHGRPMDRSTENATPCPPKGGRKTERKKAFSKSVT